MVQTVANVTMGFIFGQIMVGSLFLWVLLMIKAGFVFTHQSFFPTFFGMLLGGLSMMCLIDALMGQR